MLAMIVRSFLIQYTNMDAVGIDIIEIERIRMALTRFGEKFLNRVYTESEIRLYQNRLPSLAARFAAKEAAIKALGLKTPLWQEIEVLPDRQGKPQVHLHGKAREKARRLGLNKILISLSHSRSQAIACVIMGRTPNHS